LAGSVSVGPKEEKLLQWMSFADISLFICQFLNEEDFSKLGEFLNFEELENSV